MGAALQRLLLDDLGRPPLVQLQQSLQQVVDGGLAARLLHPHVEQLVDPVLVRHRVLALDDVVVQAQAAEEAAVVVDVHLNKVVEAPPQRLLTWRQTVSRSDTLTDGKV